MQHLLLGLVPYSRENLALAFRPSTFFSELEKLSGRSHPSIRTAYYRAQKRGLIEIDQAGIPRLTDKGRTKVKPYSAKTLPKGAKLMVIFDIPENERAKRRHLRLLLKELSFAQVQKSVWVSPFDHRELLASDIQENDLSKYVSLYEVAYLKT